MSPLRGWKHVAAAVVLVVAASSSARAQGDLRPSVVELESRTATGYERCAGVITARLPQGLEVWTAGHCANHPLSLVRFFDGYEIYGSTVRLLLISDAIDAAELFVPLDAARVRKASLAVRSRKVPPMGSALTVIGHPISELRGPNEGRWTTTAARMGEILANEESGAIQYEIYCSLCGPGDSGSGVFDAAGTLVGIVYGVTQLANVADGRLPDGLYADVVPVAALR